MEIFGNPWLSGQTLNTRAKFAWADDSGKAREMSPQEKNLRALKEGLRSLQEMSSPKQQAAGRVSQLKRRLDMMMDMLKDSLPFLTPEQAKNLVRQLKGIAREAAQQAAGEAREAQGAAVAASAAAETQAAEEASAVDEPDEANEAGETDDGEKTAGSRGATASDQGLRKTLKEAALLLKVLLSLLKFKLKDREGKKDAVTAEKHIAELEKELRQDVGVEVRTNIGIYGAQGVPVSVDVPAAVGIDVSA